MIILVITIAVNMERMIPRASVAANPLIVPEPMMPKTAAAISVVTFPSTMADAAFLNPVSIADFTVLPFASSSLIRANMITLASTAIPIDKMIPAIPGRVNVISNASRRMIISSTYSPSAKLAATPDT